MKSSSWVVLTAGLGVTFLFMAGLAAWFRHPFWAASCGFSAAANFFVAGIRARGLMDAAQLAARRL